VDRYEKEKNEIKLAAEKLEADATAWDKQSDEQMHQHHRWAQSTTVLQVSIAMAAIALLTKKKYAGNRDVRRRRRGRDGRRPCTVARCPAICSGDQSLRSSRQTCLNKVDSGASLGCGRLYLRRRW
jgi:hypothetical protein